MRTSTASAVEAVPPVGERAGGGGIGKRLLLIVGGVVMLVIVLLVVWLVLFRGDNSDTQVYTPTSSTPPATEGSERLPSPPIAPEPTAPTPLPELPPSPDADGDGLADGDEELFGTSNQLADTDSDGLSDRDEVMVYSTDPLNADTDGDTYLDGQEVRNGYNPKGAGLLFAVPGAR